MFDFADTTENGICVRTFCWRVVIEDCPQKSNVYGIWSAKGSVLEIKKSTKLRESPYSIQRTTDVRSFTHVYPVLCNMIIIYLIFDCVISYEK